MARFARQVVAARDALWAEARRWGRPAGLVVLTAVFWAYTFAFFYPRGDELKRVARAAGHEVGDAPDGRPFGYPPPVLKEYAEALTEEGRRLYVRTQVRYDLLFPWINGAMFAAWLAAGWGPCARKCAGVRWLIALPAGMVVFDYGENLTLMWLFRDYPAHWSEGLAGLAAGFTVTKWGFVAAGAIAAVVGLGVRVVQCCGDCRRTGAGGAIGS